MRRPTRKGAIAPIAARRPSIERLEPRVVLSAQSWNLADDFAADFSGGLPQNNPNGTWTYLGVDGTVQSLVATDGANPNTSVGAGWSANTPPPDVAIPSYARGGGLGTPTDSVAGHGPNRIIWRAPADVDMGGVEVTGFLTQVTLEPTRQMRMQIFRNNFGDALVDVAADFNTQNAIVNLPATQIAMQPDDFLTIVVDGSGPLGDGANTFSAFDVNIQEIGLAGDYDRSGAVDDDDYQIYLTEFGMSVSAGSGADGNSDGVVNTADFTVWRDNEGEAFLTGGNPASYTPAAIVVETTGVTLPDGSQLDISGSSTMGLQEAFDRSAEQGWSVFVLPGVYDLDAHLDIEELQLRTFRFEDVTLNFDPSVTDFGIRFDSTMLTDWYWSGGGINAPGAQDGVRYEPRTPHPLDGILFNTIGVVDSRFHWNVDITAAVNKVTMDTTLATINDLSLHFQNVTENEINVIGNGFDGANIFAAARTDDPIPFDLFDTAGRVTVVPPATDISTLLPATVFKPDGETLDVTGTSTFGLQEALDHAAANNLDLLVFGRGVRNIAPFTNLGLYNISADLSVSDLDGRTYEMYAVTLNDGRVGGTTLAIGDLINNADFEITGQVVGTNVDNVVRIRPNTTGVTNSSIRIQAVVGSNTPGDVAVRIDPGLRSITNSTLIFHEVNGGHTGIRIGNASATTQFSGNLVRSLHTHAIADIGLRLGTNGANAANLTGNTIEVRTNSDGIPSSMAMQIWGHSNDIDLYVRNTGYPVGIRLESTSSGNTVVLGDIQATQAFIDLGSGNSITFGGGSSTAFLGAAGAPSFDAAFAAAPATPAIGGFPATPPDDDELLLALALTETTPAQPANDLDALEAALDELDSGDEFVDDLAEDVGEAEIAPLVAVG